jgi:pilus assembly protein Flp/PilA
MKTILVKLLGDKAGASAAEYALILAVIGIGVVAAFTTLGGAITTTTNDAAAKINP